MPPRALPALGPRPPPRAPAAAADTDADTGDAGGLGLRPLAPRPWRWLLLLALPAACSAPPPPRPVYTNHWAVQVLGGPAAADRVAAAHGYLNLGQVSAAGLTRPKLSRPPAGAARGGASFGELPGSAARGALGGDKRVAGGGAHAGAAQEGTDTCPAVVGAVLLTHRARPVAEPGSAAPGHEGGIPSKDLGGRSPFSSPNPEEWQ